MFIGFFPPGGTKSTTRSAETDLNEAATIKNSHSSVLKLPYVAVKSQQNLILDELSYIICAENHF